MGLRFIIYLSFVILIAGCASRPNRKGILSQELPLTLDDLSEIREGEKNNDKVLWEYRVYESPQLEKYVNQLAANIAEVSTRPHLPYHVVLLDTDEVNFFGGPGGYIYITRGFFNFLESESELAGAIAHEIAHIGNYEYATIPHLSKMKTAYSALLKGSELAKDSVGTYGTAMNIGLKNIGNYGPKVVKRFTKDQEIQADERAIDYLVKAGYDPRGFQNFIDRLSKVEMQNVGKFVILMNTHPPFVDRRKVMSERIKNLSLEKSKIVFKQDLLGEVRQESVNLPDSIVFRPDFGVRETASAQVNTLDQNKSEEISAPKRRWGWV
jgi:beta-barrel assembly-enhancing protease